MIHPHPRPPPGDLSISRQIDIDPSAT